MALNCHKICYLDGEQFRKALARGNIAKMNKKSPNSTSKAPLVQGHIRNCVWESFKKRKKLGKIAEELVEEKKVKKQESKLKVARREEFQRGSMSTLIYKLMYNYFPDIIILMNLIMVSL